MDLRLDGIWYSRIGKVVVVVVIVEAFGCGDLIMALTK